MNDYEQKIRQIIETSPSWEKDGGGVRGRTLAPLIEGASGPNLMGDPMPQQFNQQRSELLQQQDDPLPKLLLEGGSGESGSPPHPWQIRLGTDDDGNTTYLVEFNSKLYSGIGSWDNIAITGLDSAALISEGYLILFGVVSGGVCTEASIQGPQSVVSDRIDFAGSDQTSFAVQLGYLYQDGTSWIVLQQAFQDLTLMSVCVNGNPAIYPMAI